MHRSARAQTRQIGVQIGLQLVHEYGQLRVIEFADGFDLSRIHNRRARASNRINRRIHQCVYRVVEAEILAHHANLRALQAFRVKVARVVDERLALAPRRGGVLGIHSRQRAQQNCRIRDSACHRTRAVLRMRNRNYAGAAYQTHRRLDPYNSIGRRWADDRPVGFCSNGNRTQIRGNRGARSRARAAGVAIQHVWISGQPAASAPPAGRMAGTDVGPFTQVRLAQNDRACCTQTLHDKRILERLGSNHRQRTRRGCHAVRCVDVIFNQHRNPMHRPAQLILFALLIEPVGNGEGIRIEFDHAVNCRSTLIHCFNPG